MWQARVDLAACFRAAARLGLHEGVCNHLSFMVPGRDDLFLVNPDGWAFSEITASRLLICDFHRHVIAGDGVPEDTAFYIHARLHLAAACPGGVPHPHAERDGAGMMEGPPLIWAGQTSLKFYGRTVVDEDYNGLALDEAEGDRIAAAVGDADIVFMKHHGVLVLARSIAKAWDDLYYLERACEVQRLAQSTGRPSCRCRKQSRNATAEQMRHEAGAGFAAAAPGKHQAPARPRRAGVSPVTRLVPAFVALLQFHRLRAGRPDGHSRRRRRPGPGPRRRPLPWQSMPRTPLVTIDYTEAAPDYAELLHYAVSAARRRARQCAIRRGVGGEGHDRCVRRAGTGGRGDAGNHAQTGCRRSRIHLGLRTDPALAASQVRVYVR